MRRPAARWWSGGRRAASAKEFYARIGFREDVDFSGPAGFRVVHFTPPGSDTSLIFGSGVTDAAPAYERGVPASPACRDRSLTDRMLPAGGSGRIAFISCQ
jgi:hypothetical protein